MSLSGNTDETNGYNSVIKNGNLANANHVKSPIPPIGSVLAWLKSLGTTHTPSLPDGWVECNGQTLSDSDSPYNGDTIPDLNGSSGTQKFLRGATASGGTGGADTINIAHSHAVTNTYKRYPETFYDSGGLSTNSQLSSAQSILPTYYEVVWIMRVK